MSKNNELNKLMVRVDKIIEDKKDDQEYADVSIGYHNFKDSKYPMSACVDNVSDIFTLSKNQLNDSIGTFNTAVKMYGDSNDPIYADNIINETLSTIYNTLNAQLVYLNNELYYRTIPIMCNELSDLSDKKLNLRIRPTLYYHLLTDYDDKLYNIYAHSSILTRITNIKLENTLMLIDSFYFDNDKEFEIKDNNVLKIMDDISYTSLMANDMSLILYNFIVLNLYRSVNQYTIYRDNEFTDEQLEDFYEEAYVIIQEAVTSIHDSYLDHLRMVLMSASDKFPYLKEYVSYIRGRMFGEITDNGRYSF